MDALTRLLDGIELRRSSERLTHSDVARRIGMHPPTWRQVRTGARDLDEPRSWLIAQMWPELTTPVIEYRRALADAHLAESGLSAAS